ncbi:VOC family protein [Allonocardiopsis opalescens]|uniref:VOC domain-containing protein n=1 Tax=Allonocardiopsis opalescens TaxID=1144618 RepID=A0A2T0QD30_9ACTN|nr:VOC family protein [Allonocardiopsis opalescens]PRY01770.1 hypothetical protein CLV72_101365 [Allonocardiopsis opalescens]
MSDPVVNFELPADDVERARGFYREAFGWEITAFPEMDYTMLGTSPVDENGAPTQPGAINGGMVKRESASDVPMIVIRVGDIAAALEKVERLGGKAINPAKAVGNMGFSATCADSEGNVIGLWQDAA